MTRKEAGAGKAKAEPVVPQDEVSFCAFIRGLNRRINKFQKHLNQLSNVHDYRARRRLEVLIDRRGRVLCQPPESVPPETIRVLREEISR